MNYHNITKDDMLNGEGLRVVLWVSGCSHNCKECQNPETHDLNSGIPFDGDAMLELITALEEPHIAGITFSGGDPLHIENRTQIEVIAKYIKEELPDKNIWLYTGYRWEEIKDLPIVKYIDVLVDGRFVLELKDTKLEWKGSSNQRVIDVKKTLLEDKIILNNYPHF